MKKIIFYSYPGHGHTNPTLIVLKELSKRGYKVIYYSTEEFREKIESAGLEYRSYTIDQYKKNMESRNFGIFIKILMEITETQTDTLLNEAKKENPDLIIYDHLCLWGKIIGNSLELPCISIFTTFVVVHINYLSHPKHFLPILLRAMVKRKNIIQAYILYSKLCKKYKLHVEKIFSFMNAKGNLNIVFTSSYLQPASESFNETFKFVGPSIYPRNEKYDFLKKLDKKKKVIYISMGTIFNDNVQFYRMCIDIFAKTDYQIIISLGHRFSEKDLPSIPSNIIVKNHIPQLEVLQKADLFISHAGMNSINESLYNGVPMILIPQMYEQDFNAFRVQQLGAGVYIKPRDVTEELLMSNVDKVISTKSYYINAKKVEKTLKDAGGYKKAADEISDYLEKYDKI
jgi:MGT family glycosyltransferase